MGIRIGTTSIASNQVTGDTLPVDTIVEYDGTTVPANWEQVYEDGWHSIGVVLTYSSADDPTYVVTTASDLTGPLSVGMKMKFTNNSTTFYGFITAIASGTITLYGGTDYDVANSAITAVYYSTEKAPYGFVINRDKWSVIYSTNTEQRETAPTTETFYNTGTVKIDVPIGRWNISESFTIQVNLASSGPISMFSTLSTSTSSSTVVKFDNYMTMSPFVYGSNVVRREAFQELTTKATYYLIFEPLTTIDSYRISGNGFSNTTIKAVCEYL